MRTLAKQFLGWIARAGRLEIAVLLALGLSVAGLWAFGILAAEVAEKDTGKFDERLLLDLRQTGDKSIPIGPPWTVQVARDRRWCLTSPTYQAPVSLLDIP